VLEAKRGTFRREELLRVYGDTPEAVNAPEVRELDEARLALCLAKLPERERSVVILSFYSDEPADAVARELGLTPGNARVIRHRAVARLRDCMNLGEAQAG
jgi:RNA polymerase sigma-70 factor, ECF subfamily